MKLASVAVAYYEPRFIKPHLEQLDVDEKLVLNSLYPWQGEPIRTEDATANIAGKVPDTTVIQHYWPDEAAQRNAGQEYFYDKDWIWVLDPDEFLLKEDQIKLKEFLEDAPLDAYVCESQFTYWKSGFVIEPPESYQQIIAVRPQVRYAEKRVVDCVWGIAPVVLHHFSWARTDAEVLKKIQHYSHANEFDGEKWFKEVWQADKRENVHPLTPEALKKVVSTKLPKELEELDLWPPVST